MHVRECNVEIFKNSFIYSAAFHFHSLPKITEQVSSLDSFKGQIFQRSLFDMQLSFLITFSGQYND